MEKIKKFLGNKWVGFALATLLYVLWFVVWTGNLWMLLGVVVIYDVYITKYPKVYDVAVDCWTVPTKRHYEMYEDPADVEALYHYEEVKEPAFGADKVYYNDGRRLLLYPDRVIRIDAPEGLTEEQMKIVAEKLTADL